MGRANGARGRGRGHCGSVRGRVNKQGRGHFEFASSGFVSGEQGNREADTTHAGEHSEQGGAWNVGGSGGWSQGDGASAEVGTAPAVHFRVSGSVEGEGVDPAAGRRRSIQNTGVAARPGTKGKNFVREQEEQLARSVLHVTFDPITGNQQRGSAFWERISVHYNGYRLHDFRFARSLEFKWGLIKHDVGKRIGVYQQVKNLNKTGTNEADTLRKIHKLYRVNSKNNLAFLFEHVWTLVKEDPRWGNGWSAVKVRTSKRKAVSSDQQCNPQCGLVEGEVADEVSG